MNSRTGFGVRLHARFFAAAIVVLIGSTAWSGVQPAWLARYNAGLAQATNTVLGMALDGQGNIVVAGSSTAAAGDYDYLTLKYAPDGRLLWSARYASISNLDDQVHAMGLDSQGDVYLTGSSVTAKYSSAGALEWTAPFAGRDLAVGSDGFVYVTGFSGRDSVNGIRTGDFVTVKLTPEGSNVWARTTDFFGAWDRSDKVLVDEEGSVYVAGPTAWGCYGPLGHETCYTKYGLVKYDRTGTQLWTTAFPSIAFISERVVALVPHGPWIYFCGHGDSATFATFRISSGGAVDWGQGFGIGAEGASALAVYSDDAVYVTGSDILNATLHAAYITFKADSAGNPLWQATYNNGAVPGYHRANAMALDASGNIYVTGRSDSTAGDADWATIKYNPAGQEQWVRRYEGPAHGVDEATAIAVDPSGNVYVAGTQTTANGSIETVLIKYVDLTNIELLTTGTAVLRFLGSPGQSCRLQASTNLSDWSDVLGGAAGSDGVVRFEDTNAPAYPTRFYRSVSP